MFRFAFTMLEIVVVIVIIGILAVNTLPSYQRDSVAEAAHQVMNHIRYTQHLALVDDRYSATDASWYRGRWQIMFLNNRGSNNEWAYTIFSDRLGGSTGNPDPREIALNPLDRSKKLTGGTSGNELIQFNDDEMTQEMNLQRHYGITSIRRSNCSGGNLRISFDHMGRPFVGALQSLSDPYTIDGTSRLLQLNAKGMPCVITLSNGSEEIAIAVIPETGYVCIWSKEKRACE